MNISPFLALACPLDGARLQRKGSAWCCAAGHSFDIAAQGYIHLLPVQKKRSRDPGDSKEMVAARRRFLNARHYQPIAAAASRAMLTAMLGLDISKWAVLAAAKQDQRPNWVVGSNANLPVLPGTLDRVLCMFGFPVYSEFARVLKAGGELLQVDTGPNHLRELREIIYPSLKPERSADAQPPDGFTQLASETLSYPLHLGDAEQIADLLAMTPHLYRASAEGRARAAALTALSLTVEVRLSRFGRNAS